MRVIGVDIGKTSLKAVCLEKEGESWQIGKTFWKAHQQQVEEVWQELKNSWHIGEEELIVTTGRLRQILPFPSIVEKIAQEQAVNFLYPNQDVTLIRLGGGGFSVLTVKKSGPNEFRQNPRCAAGVGSFLDQILSRRDLDIFQADRLAGRVEGVKITSRCGVTMKTDFTHLLNTGHQPKEVVAGLLDSSAKNAVSLALKGEIAPSVLIIGGLSVSNRIVQTIRNNLPSETEVKIPEQALCFEALGAGLVAERKLEEKDFCLTQPESETSALDYLPSLGDSLDSVTKIKAEEHKAPSRFEAPVLGLDIGSTGSKLVVFDERFIFESYTETQGQPVEAAKSLIREVPSEILKQIRAIGCTGSGREIVANLLKASLPESERWRVFVLNEIAAHAEGAHYYDEEVDTIVDIGGQDAKFTRLEAGRVIDSCMNTVCSAGTGSFLAEQLQFLGIRDVKQFGRIALDSSRAVDLGQHCAVFISEQIDKAKRKGANLPEIIAGLYYSIVLNYNNRVKGQREYGKKIFLQGKPAENIALACALAKVSGNPIIVPPSPGTPGALGIALLTKKELAGKLFKEEPLDLSQFLGSQILEKREFRCQSKDGCLTGNLCPIQVITVRTGGETTKFFWGGACDKYEKKPDKDTALAQAPHPFLERERLLSALMKNGEQVSAKSVAVPRGLETEEILPLAITFFQELGLKVEFQQSLNLEFLEAGARLCQATFCAPLQLLAGQAKLQQEDFVFLPKVVEISGIITDPEEQRCYVCPLSQAMPDLFSPRLSTQVLQPILDFKRGYEGNQEEFLKMGNQLGYSKEAALSAFRKAISAQKDFEERCLELGQEALDFAEKHQLSTIVVLGHPYVVNTSLLLAGIPEAIQENGAISLPIDCYPLKGEQSLPPNMYWGYGQRLLQAAWQIRRHKGVYPLWLSVYSCGPDSFLLHFFQYLARGKPYTILESDAYTGQAGFKTRVEAFLYGVKHYREEKKESLPEVLHFDRESDLAQVKEADRRILVPWMGEGSKILAAVFQSGGIESEALPLEDEESLELARKFTSGKECLPMIITLGGLLKYLKNHQGRFYYFMPQAGGPCRFGQYQLLFKIILEKTGLADRVEVVSPTSEKGYQGKLKIGSATMAKLQAGLCFVDFLKDALFQVRPEQRSPGLAEQLFARYLERAEQRILSVGNNWLGLKDLWGMKPLAKRAARDFQRVPRDSQKQGKPVVLVTGEIFVRLNSFANNQTIKKLEDLGVKVRLSPFREWANYVTFLRRTKRSLGKTNPFKVCLTYRIQSFIEQSLYQVFAERLGWSKDHKVEEILETARPYLRDLKPQGEAGLTIGLPLLLWQKREIAGTVVVGPFECMPSRIAETQLDLISRQTGLPVLNLSFYGESLDKDLLESFVWDLTP